MSIDIRPHVFQGFPPIRIFNDSLHLLFCIFYGPLLNIPRRVKWYDFSVGTIEVKQTHQYSDGLSASGPMFIRGFPLNGYLMTVSNPHLFVHFLSPVVNYSASNKMV